MKITIFGCVEDHGYKDKIYRLKSVTYDKDKKPRVKLVVRGIDPKLETKK